MNRAKLFVVGAPLALGGCLLLESLDGLSGAAPEAGPNDATADARDANGLDASAGGDGGPIAFVQASARSSRATSAADVTLANVVAGHAIVVAIIVKSAPLTIMSISDAQNDSYATVVGPFDSRS